LKIGKYKSQFLKCKQCRCRRFRYLCRCRRFRYLCRCRRFRYLCRCRRFRYLCLFQQSCSVAFSAVL